LTLPDLTGLTFTVGDGTDDATMTFQGTMADINLAMDGLAFTPSQDFTGATTVQIISNDLGNIGSGGSLTDTDSVTINVSAVNDAPVNIVPGDQATYINLPLFFNTASGNLIQVSDVDVASGNMRVTLTATNGRITLAAGFSGLSFTTGDGTNDTTMTFTGTVANLNFALDGMRFTPTNNFVGFGGVTFTTSDLGNSGTGGTLTDTDSVVVEVVTERRVNTTTSGNQLAPAIAADEIGNYVIVWTSQNVDRPGLRDRRAALTTTLGQPVGSEFGSTRRRATTSWRRRSR
jgi:hypothetical protein